MFNCVILCSVAVLTFTPCFTADDFVEPLQPSWTVKGNFTVDPNFKVHASVKSLKEVERLRDEIQDQIEEGRYVVGRPNESAIIKMVDKALGEPFRTAQHISQLLGTTLDSENDDFSGISPNTVESAYARENGDEDVGEEDDFESLFERYISNSNGYREQLRIDYILEDPTFKFGENVIEWRTFDRLNRKLLIGRERNSILCFEYIDSSWSLIQELEVDESYTALETVSYWNETREDIEGVLVVATLNKVFWVDVNYFQIIWVWEVEEPVTALKALELEDINYMAAVHSSSKTTYITIHQFDLVKKGAVQLQTIPLDTYCEEMVFLDVGPETALAVPQKDSVVIFTLMMPHDSTIRVIRVTSKGVKTVSGFQMEGITYLAITGQDPQILQYHAGIFVPQTILSASFGFVDFFLAVPSGTYREDLVLLVQHQINYDSHFLSVVEPLVWNGEAFESTPSVPCKIGDVELEHGVACLMDPDREEGIKGAAVFHLEGKPRIIIPREAEPSGYFTCFMELVPEKSEDEQLAIIFDHFKQVGQFIQQTQNEANNFLERASDVQSNEPRPLKIDELLFDGTVDEIFVNGEKLTEADYKIDMDQLLGEMEVLTKELLEFEESQNAEITPSEALIRKREVTDQTVEANNVNITHLFVEQVNGVPIEDVIFIKNNQINHNGTIVFEHPVTVADAINAKHFSVLHNEENVLNYENIVVNGDVTILKINGEPWEELLESTVLLNQPLEIDELQVNGEVILDEELKIETLNGDKFPDQFLLSVGPAQSIVTGEKRFMSELYARSVDCEGTIQGVNPFDLVTLDDEQVIPGWTTFHQIKVTERLEISGTISGEYMEDFLPNPTLLHMKHVKSACFFKHLEVLGPVYVDGYFNGINLTSSLEDVLYKTENDIEINSLKSFESISVENNIQLTSNLINDIRFDDFLTKSGDQEVYITDLNGNLQVKNLELSGLFDFVNITELDHSSVKRFGEQYINSELIFEEPYGIQAERVKITKTLNQVAVEKYVTIDDPQSTIEFELLEFLEDPNVRNLSVAENGIVIGNGQLNTIDLKEIDATRISASKDNQTITSEASIDTMYAESTINVRKINGFDANLLLKVLADFDDIPRHIESGDFVVQELAVSGDISVSTINERRFNDIVENVVWLNRENTILADIDFLDPIFVESNLEINGLLNERNYNQFVENLAFKDDPNLVVTGVKRFQKTIEVTNDLKVRAINQIPYDFIAKKTAPLNIDGTVVINGELIVNNLKFDGFFNGFPASDLRELVYEYDNSTGTHILKNADIHFSQPVEIEHLKVEGGLNKIENFQAFIDSIIYKNSSTLITGKKAFTKKIIFQDGVEIDYFNGLDLRNFLDNVVYKNEPEPVTIAGPIVFKGPVSGAYIMVEGNVDTTNLMGCSMQEWLTNGLRTDMNVTIPGRTIFYPGSLDGNNIVVDYLNEVAMSDIITLHTEQHFDGFYQFTDMYLKDSMMVEGRFCGVDVAKEYENTVLNYGNQTIDCETTFQQVRVLDKLETLGPINGKDLNQLVNINSDVEIRSPLYFRSVSVENLHTNDSVSGFDFEDWSRNALWSCGRDEQEVTGNWKVDRLAVRGSVQGNGLINGVMAEEIEKQFEDIDLEGVNKLFDVDYQNACLELQTTLEVWNNRSYSVEYTDWAFDVTLDGPVNVFLVFDYQNGKFILANTGCSSTVLKWEMESDVLDILTVVETGYLRQIVAIPGEENELFLVTLTGSGHGGCNNKVSTVWTFHGEKMIYSHALNKTDGFSDMNFRSDSPGTIYAIDKTARALVEMKLRSREQRTWDLSGYEPEHLQFIPAEANLGLAITGRRQVFIINSDVKQSHRKRRSLPMPYPDPTSSSHHERCLSRVEAGGGIESQTFSDEYNIENHAQECILRERFTKLNPKSEPLPLPKLTLPSDNVGVGRGCTDCYAPKVQHVVHGIVEELTSDLEAVKSDSQLSESHGNPDYYDGEHIQPNLKRPSEYDETTFGGDDESKRRIFEHLHQMEKTTKILTTPAKNAINYGKLKRFSKKVTAKLYHGFNEIRDIHKAIDRVRGKGHHLYVSQPFHKQLVHESLSAPNKHEYQIERPTLHTITEILNILNNGRKHIEFTIHDFPLNDVQEGLVGAGSANANNDWVADKFRNVEKEIRKIVKQLLAKSNELSEVERREKDQAENSVDSNPDMVRKEQELNLSKTANSLHETSANNGGIGKANVTTVSSLGGMTTVRGEEIGENAIANSSDNGGIGKANVTTVSSLRGMTTVRGEEIGENAIANSSDNVGIGKANVTTVSSLRAMTTVRGEEIGENAIANSSDNDGIGKANVTTVSSLRTMTTVRGEEFGENAIANSSDKEESSSKPTLHHTSKLMDKSTRLGALSKNEHSIFSVSNDTLGSSNREIYRSRESLSDLGETEQVTTESSLGSASISTDRFDISDSETNRSHERPSGLIANKTSSDGLGNLSAGLTAATMPPRAESTGSIAIDGSDLTSRLKEGPESNPHISKSQGDGMSFSPGREKTIPKEKVIIDSVSPDGFDLTTKEGSQSDGNPSNLKNSKTISGSTDDRSLPSGREVIDFGSSAAPDLRTKEDDGQKSTDTFSPNGENSREPTARIGDGSTKLPTESENMREAEITLGVPISLQKATPKAEEKFTLDLDKTALEIGEPEEEPLISKPITADDYLVADISHLPSLDSGEIVVIEVGPESNRQMFIVITELKDHMAKGGHDTVRIYYDIHESSLFQTISATRPRNLVALQWRDETILGYVEGDYTIKLYSYRGVGGFVPLSEVHSDKFITSLSPSSVGGQNNYGKCPKQFIIAAIENKLRFHEIVMSGNCFPTNDLKCFN